MKKNWKAVVANFMSRKSVPARSGIYCFMESKNIEGLKTETKAIYVGQSKNMRTRFMQHMNFDKCHNHKLLVDLMAQSNSKVIEFNFFEAPQSNLDEIEKDLISKLKPKHNVQMNGGQNV